MDVEYDGEGGGLEFQGRERFVYMGGYVELPSVGVTYHGYGHALRSEM